jgi:UDP-2,3-diacylglucosamine hydrolase
MPEFIDISSEEVYFIADTHFRDGHDAAEAARRDLFIQFLHTVPDHGVLFLLGDILDFYFEYRSVVSNRYQDIFSALASLHQRGVEMHFLGGNHDFWVGDFFPRELGVRVHGDEILIESQGRRIVCAHGDLVMPGDWGYKILKNFIRNRFIIGVSRWIHPDMMDAIATRVSHGSRTFKSGVREDRARGVADHGKRLFYSRGNDAFIMGHVHYPLHENDDGKDFIILGDWIDQFSYARLRDGKLSLETFTG